VTFRDTSVCVRACVRAHTCRSHAVAYVRLAALLDSGLHMQTCSMFLHHLKSLSIRGFQTAVLLPLWLKSVLQACSFQATDSLVKKKKVNFLFKYRRASLNMLQHLMLPLAGLGASSVTQMCNYGK